MLIPFPFERYVPPQFSLRIAREPWEVAGCMALRRTVFCDEQAIFAGDDRDEADTRATMLAAVGLVAGMADTVLGTARIHEAERGIWFGSRLAVAAECRRIGGLATGLIRLAVGTARARGAVVFRAHVQDDNIALFESLHWRPLGPVDLHARPHHLMQAALEHYPSIEAGDLCLTRTRRAA